MTRPTIIRLDVPATYAQLHLLGACIVAAVAQVEGIVEPEIVSYNVQLAANEIFTNIAGHAYAGQPDGRVAITITLGVEPRRIMIDLYDTGIAFEPADVPTPDLEAGQIHGYGLFLVEQLMDEVRYRPQHDGNYWHLVKTL